MAGGSHHKSSSGKPSASSSSSQRKSRWEPGSNSRENPSLDLAKKSGDPSKLSSNPKSNPSPARPGPSPSQVHPKAPLDQGHPPPGRPFAFPDLGPPPPPAYGFHKLERRTIVLADGSVRSYFALPPDYQDFAPLPLPRLSAASDFGGGVGRLPPISPEGFREDPYGRGGARAQDYWNSLGLDGRGAPEGSLKRKFGEDDEKRGDFSRERNPNGYRSEFSAGTSSPFRRDDDMRVSKYARVGGTYDSVKTKHLEVDQSALKKSFLHFAKVINENPTHRKNYLENGKHGTLKCVVCGRSSKDFVDMHALITHTYNSDNADLVDHLGLHKALCVLMGWNYSKPPDNSKAYQFVPADEAAANQDDLIIWPPMVIIHNTLTGKNKDGRMEGLGNKAMDVNIKDLGVVGGKSKSLYGREGHLGITLVKFAADQSGLKEAIQLAENLEKENRGRKSWTRVQPPILGKDDDKNPNLVTVDEKTGEKKRIFYGYLGTAGDLDKLDYDTRKKVTIESKRERSTSE